MAIFAAVAYREGWEEVLFLLMFLAIWRLAAIEPAGDSSRRFPPTWSVTTSTQSMHPVRGESGVATVVTRYLACAASLQNAEPLLLRAQFVEPFERRIDLLAVLGVRVHLLKPANECNIFRTQFRRQLVHSLIQLIDFLLIF